MRNRKNLNTSGWLMRGGIDCSWLHSRQRTSFVYALDNMETVQPSEFWLWRMLMKNRPQRTQRSHKDETGYRITLKKGQLLLGEWWVGGFGSGFGELTVQSWGYYTRRREEPRSKLLLSSLENISRGSRNKGDRKLILMYKPSIIDCPKEGFPRQKHIDSYTTPPGDSVIWTQPVG